jgi:hypothetical protein
VTTRVGPPAPRPCDSCPYRREVASGIWDFSEYEKLRRYDADTPYQPPQLFQCHQTDLASDRKRVCAGWAGCHDGNHLLALRLAVAQGLISEDTARAVVEYATAVPLFASGAQAADHGQHNLDHPDATAMAAIAKIERARGDLIAVVSPSDGTASPPLTARRGRNTPSGGVR